MIVDGSAPILSLSLYFLFFLGEGRLTWPSVCPQPFYSNSPQKDRALCTLVLPSVRKGDWIFITLYAFFFQQGEKHFNSLLPPYLLLFLQITYVTICSTWFLWLLTAQIGGTLLSYSSFCHLHLLLSPRTFAQVLDMEQDSASEHTTNMLG